MSQIEYKEPTRKDHFLSNLLVLLTIILLVLSGFFILESLGIFLYSLIVFLVIFLLVFWHTATHGYVCPECGNEFSISFWRSLPTASSIFIKKKMLTCPECGIKDYMAEVIKHSK